MKGTLMEIKIAGLKSFDVVLVAYYFYLIIGVSTIFRNLTALWSPWR